MYDYRSAIQKILNHTSNQEKELINSAYAIHTICDVVLKTQQLANQSQIQDNDKPIDKPTDIKPDNTKSAYQAASNQAEVTIYSLPFINKLNQIVNAKHKLKLNQVLKHINANKATVRRIINAKSAIKARTKNPYNVRKALKTRDNILKSLNLDPRFLLDDSIPKLTDEQAKTALTIDRPIQKPIEYSVKKPAPTTIRLKPEYDSFGKLMHDVRLQLELNQTEFGKKVHSSMSSVSELENGHRIPSVEVIKDLADLTGLSIAQLQSHVKKPAESSHPSTRTSTQVSTDNQKTNSGFLMYQGTSNKELMAHVLKKPLPLNTYLARRNFNQLQLLNNKGDIVYSTNVLNSQNKDIHTGDLVTANVLNKHQAYFLKVTNRKLKLDNYVTLKNATVANRYGQWVTYGSQNQSLGDLNPYQGYYNISALFAKNNHMNENSLIDITWRKQEPEHIVVTKVTTEDHAASKV